MGNVIKDGNADFSANPEYVRETLVSIRDLAKAGRPQTAIGFQERINDYFMFCADRGLRPGIESMALACGMDRRRFWEICNGSKGVEWQEIALTARQCVVSFVESSMYAGRLNPTSAIFALKQFGWSDTVCVETVQIDSKESSLVEMPDFSQLLPKNESGENKNEY